MIFFYKKTIDKDINLDTVILCQIQSLISLRQQFTQELVV